MKECMREQLWVRWKSEMIGARCCNEIANTLNEVLKPQGVAVVVQATHGCMTTRGVHKSAASLVTSRMLGVFRRQPQTRHEFLSTLDLSGAGLSSVRTAN